MSIKRIVYLTLAALTFVVAGSTGAKVKADTTPSICCVIPCPPPLVCQVR